MVDDEDGIEEVGRGGAVLNDVGPSLPGPLGPLLLLVGIGPFILEVGRKVSLPFVLEAILLEPGWGFLAGCTVVDLLSVGAILRFLANSSSAT